MRLCRNAKQKTEEKSTKPITQCQVSRFNGIGGALSHIYYLVGLFMRKLTPRVFITLDIIHHLFIHYFPSILARTIYKWICLLASKHVSLYSVYSLIIREMIRFIAIVNSSRRMIVFNRHQLCLLYGRAPVLTLIVFLKYLDYAFVITDTLEYFNGN